MRAKSQLEVATISDIVVPRIDILNIEHKCKIKRTSKPHQAHTQLLQTVHSFAIVITRPVRCTPVPPEDYFLSWVLLVNEKKVLRIWVGGHKEF